MAAPPPLMDDHVEEVLIRLPPDDPASLVRAALVCRRWCGLVSDPSFRRRFREFHRTPPVLGFVYYTEDGVSTFARTSSCPPIADRGELVVMDARHGSLLLLNPNWWVGYPCESALIVWNPVTNEQWELPMLPTFQRLDDQGWTASVLCANYSTCDHLDCSSGPFLVVLVTIEGNDICAYSYSSDAGAWSKPATAWHPLEKNIDSDWQSNSVLVGNALYVKLSFSKSILEFDLGTGGMSVVDLPTSCDYIHAALMNTESGGLGFAYVKGTSVYLWSKDASSDGSGVWAQSRVVINFKTLLPASAYTVFDVVSFANGVSVIFLRVHDEIYRFDAKSCQVRMVCNVNRCLNDIFPYMSFYTPAVVATSPSGAGTSSSRST